MGSTPPKLSNFSPMMGFTVNVDTKLWKKFWFQEPNNVSRTIKPFCVFSNQLGSKLSSGHAQTNVLADLMLKYLICLLKNNDFNFLKQLQNLF